MSHQPSVCRFVTLSSKYSQFLIKNVLATGKWQLCFALYSATKPWKGSKCLLSAYYRSCVHTHTVFSWAKDIRQNENVIMNLNIRFVLSFSLDPDPDPVVAFAFGYGYGRAPFSCRCCPFAICHLLFSTQFSQFSQFSLKTTKLVIG